jgi:Uncharacterised nucleotidyltransferase
MRWRVLMWWQTIEGGGMDRFHVEPDYALLARVLRDPAALDRLAPAAFARAIDAANAARLLGWLLECCRERGVPSSPPAWLADRLQNAAAVSQNCELAVRWEIDRLQRAFLGTDQLWILLKGAAYIAAKLPPGAGRRVADIDVLVPMRDLAAVEGILRQHGWETAELDGYDNRYYREWMHELPPMVHRERHSTVDVHHAILPRTSRLKPASERLLARSQVVNDVRVLCPSHLVLHAAAHLFHDGEIAGAVRDLVDLDQLLRHFGRDTAFWEDLQNEAAALDLMRPLFYATRYAHRWFSTPMPRAFADAVSGWGPPAGVRAIMDRFVERSVASGARRGSSAAVLALYVRAHWLRMPPLQVARHLARKTFRNRPA